MITLNIKEKSDNLEHSKLLKLNIIKKDNIVASNTNNGSNNSEPSKLLKLNIINKDNIVVSNTNNESINTINLDTQPKNLKLTVTSFSTNVNFNKKPKFPRVKKWTLELVYERGKEIHNNKYDYSLVNISHVQGRDSYIPIKCRECEHIWEATIHAHLTGHKTGCPECGGKIPWSLERFLQKSKLIHGDKFDYSEITEKHIKGKDSRIPIKCKICLYSWTPTIHDHAYRKNGCPSCYGTAPITLESFLSRAKLKYGDKYDYSLIKKEHIKNSKSSVDIKCNNCQKVWQSVITYHLNAGTECTYCSEIYWNLERFIKRANEIHGDKYNYSHISEDDIKGCIYKVYILCNSCNRGWYTNISCHISSRSGCPKCKFSKGELKCANTLESFKILYEIEFIIESLPRKKYDFMFIYNNIKYLLEFDGEHHFKYNNFFHRNEENFLERQRIDVVKTSHALQYEYKLIRIAHCDIHNIEFHLSKALNSGVDLYLSSPSLYEYITSKLQ